MALLLRSVIHPLLGDRYPFLFLFLAIILAAAYGGYGPSLLALSLSWIAIDLLSLAPPLNPEALRSNPQFAFCFFTVGLAVTVLGGSLRAARLRTAADQAELRRAFEAQKAERDRFEITLASIADAVISTDPEGRVIFLNPVACRLTGWNPEEAAGRPLCEVFRLVEGDSPRDSGLLLARSVAPGDASTSGDELRLLARDGPAVPIEHRASPIQDARGRIQGVAIVFRDITERRRAHQAKKESEERFHQLADHIDHVFWLLEVDGPRIVYISQAYESLWGRSCASLYEQPLSYLDAVHPEDRQRATLALEKLVNGEARADEYRIIRPDGSIRWVWDRGFPIRDERGRVVRIAGIAEDITERKRVEEERRAADRRKEEFLAVLSHELRNPLAPIQTALELLEQKRRSGAGAERELEMIRRHVRILGRLVDDLLDVSRISRGKIELRKELLELNEVAAQAVEAIRPVFDERQLDLRVALSGRPIWVEADATRMEQVLYNLLLNASKYTPQGGRVWLDLESDERQAIIRVGDTGIGIEPDLLPRVFDLFLQGERRIGLSHEGGGIGLSMAKNLVELHGGRIAASSPGPNRGSVFTVRLPLTSAEPSPRVQLPRPVEPEAPGISQSWRVLIVDDNVPAADSLGRMMSLVLDQDVRVVYSGPTALQMARSFLPDLVLLDLEMAGMDGYEVARRLREIPDCSSAVIVAVTGWGHEEDRRRSRELGLDMHLVKPVKRGELQEMLESFEPRLQGRRPPRSSRDPAANDSAA
jgi:PAS domain S-box-containing protein